MKNSRIAARHGRRGRPRPDASLGQAMVEYALIVAGLMGGIGAMSLQIFPDFIEALQIYLNGYYLLLNLPIP